MSSKAFLTLQLFWNHLKRITVNSSLSVWYNSPGKSSGPWLLLVRSFGGFFTDSILLLIVCSYFVFLPNSVLEDCTFLEIYPCLLVCPFYWCIIIHSILL